MTRRYVLATVVALTLACGMIPAPLPTGVVKEGLTTETPTATPKLPELAISATPEPVTVSGNWNCRITPSISAAIVVTLRDGAIVQPTGETRNGWSEVRYKEYAPCWIAAF